MHICIVSNIYRADLKHAMVLPGLHFDHIVTSNDVRPYKPRPEIIEAALDALGLAHHEVLHFGDSRTSDVAGAQAMKIPVAWVNRSGKPGAEQSPPTYEVRDLAELSAILQASAPR